MKTKYKFKKTISLLLITFILITLTIPVYAETQTQEVTAPVFSLPSNSEDGQLKATVKGRTVVKKSGGMIYGNKNENHI